MKKRVLSLILAMLLLAVSLAGCGQKTFTTNEARNGVVRVLAFYEGNEYYDVEDLSFLGTSTVQEVISSGSAFGVGTAGEETDTFVTNRHVLENTLMEPVVMPVNYADGSDGRAHV